jgi:HPt (histidine-containing phosphotransfer) domain-containing protein
MLPRTGDNLLDPRALFAGCGGDPVLLRKLIDSLHARVPERLAALRDAVRRQDLPAVRRVAHSLRGLVSTFSSSVAAAVAVLEHGNAAGQTESAARQCEAIARLIDALSATLADTTIVDLQRLAALADRS